MEEAQAYLDRWEINWADTRIHGTTKRQVAAMFAEDWRKAIAQTLLRNYQVASNQIYIVGRGRMETEVLASLTLEVGHQIDTSGALIVIRRR